MYTCIQTYLVPRYNLPTLVSLLSHMVVVQGRFQCLKQS